MNGSKSTIGAFLCFVILAHVITWLANAQAQGAERLRAGAAKVDITPKESDLTIPTDSIRDHLYTRAIVLDDGNTCAVLVGLDQGVVRENIISEAVSKASSAIKCPSDNFFITATHTHSGQTGGMPGEGKPLAETLADSIVSAVTAAKSRLAPARVGYGTAKVDLNVNRDLFNDKQEWRQAPNPDGPSDKTLAVVEFIGEDYVPIGVFMNYAMHPINFYLSGIISADFPGEAQRYIEELFDNRTVAIFSQGTLGDQNPRLGYSPPYRMQYEYYAEGTRPPVQTVGPPPPRPVTRTRQGFNPARAASSRKAIPPENLDAYKKAVARTGDYVIMLGHMIGTTAVRLMREEIQPSDSGRIWGGQETITCPGRDRLDADNPARENVFPGYKDGTDVKIKVSVLRIGDIFLVGVNGELYTNIGLKLKAASPANRTIVASVTNGFSNAGYIYSDDAYSHLTFQVIGSRLKPSCAEGKIITTAVDLIHQSEK